MSTWKRQACRDQWDLRPLSTAMTHAHTECMRLTMQCADRKWKAAVTRRLRSVVTVGTDHVGVSCSDAVTPRTTANHDAFRIIG